MARGHDRVRGLIVGLALGEAMGRPSPREVTTPRTEPGGDARPGGETSLTLAVAESLVDAAARGPQPLLQRMVERLVAWGETTSAEDAPDAASHEAVARLRRGVPWDQAGVSWSKDSGAPLRAAPIGVVFARYPPLLREVALLAASTTHGHPTAQCAAVTLAVCVRDALNGDDPAGWADAAARAISGLPCGEMLDALNRMHAALSRAEDPALLESLGQGWCADEAVTMGLAALLRHRDDFAAAVRAATHPAGNSATVGAVAGALAGARLGHAALPASWVARLDDHAKLLDLADRLDATAERLQ